MNRVFAYKDLSFRIIACLIGTHFLLVYGDTRSIFYLLLRPGYYISLLGSFIIAFILFSAIRHVFIQLDKRFDWYKHLPERIGLQVFFGLIIPAIVAFLLAFIYFKMRNDSNILKTSYLRYDFQFIIVLLIVMNLYYMVFYFYQRSASAERSNRFLKENMAEGAQAIKSETVQISRGAKSISLHVDDIAYLFREKDINFLKSIAGEEFYINQSLDEMQQQLPERKFFRANRQLIVNRAACKGFDLIAYGKLNLQLEPAFTGNNIISQKRAVAFKKWTEANNISEN